MLSAILETLRTRPVRPNLGFALFMFGGVFGGVAIAAHHYGLAVAPVLAFLVGVRLLIFKGRLA
jgi:hypothetical protein